MCIVLDTFISMVILNVDLIVTVKSFCVLQKWSDWLPSKKKISHSDWTIRHRINLFQLKYLLFNIFAHTVLSGPCLHYQIFARQIDYMLSLVSYRVLWLFWFQFHFAIYSQFYCLCFIFRVLEFYLSFSSTHTSLFVMMEICRWSCKYL